MEKKKKNQSYLESLRELLEEEGITAQTINNLGSRPTEQSTQTITSSEEKKDRKWFQKGAFEDGYQFGDISKAILGTTDDAWKDLQAGAFGIVEGTIDAGAYLIGGVGGLFGAKGFQSKMEDFIEKDLIDEEAIAKSNWNPLNWNAVGLGSAMHLGGDSEDESVFGDKTDSLVQSGGQLAGQIGLQAVGVPWFVTSGVTSFGSQVEGALNEGASYGEAGLSGIVSAGADILTEKMFGGSGLGEKGLINLEPLTKGISNKVIKALADYGVDVMAEGSEEVVASVISKLGDSLYKEESLSELLMSEEAIDEYIESFIGGAALGGIMNSSNAYKSAKSGRDYRTGLNTDEQTVVEKEVEKRIAEEEKNGKTLSKKEKDEIYDRVLKDLDKGYISIDTIEEALGGDTYKDYREVNDYDSSLIDKLGEMQKEFDTLNDMKDFDMTGKQRDRREELRSQIKELTEALNDEGRITNRTQLRSQLGEEVFNKAQNSRLIESYYEVHRRTQGYEADLSKYDAKQQAIIKKAVDSGILNNTRRTHEFVDFVAKLSADKGVLFDFTDNQKLKESGFAIDGKTVNGYVTKDGITLNINATKTLETIAGHEITHVLEGTELYNELQKAVFEYAKTKKEFDSRRKELADTYKNVKGADIDAELTADLVGDYLFADADFINNLSVNHRNVFQKIYDEIKYLYKIATVGSKEARELEKVKKVFADAYKLKANTTKTDGEVDYSISAEQQEYFKDSVVRDENGDLKVMYHGTSKGGFNSFDTYGSNYGLFGTGSYFTDSKNIAESYTNKGKGQNKQVYESYLNITNPIDMDAQADAEAWKKAVPDAMFPESGTNEQFYRAMEEYLEDEMYSKWEAAEFAMDTLMGMGYDGITHIGGGRVNADGERHQVYIAFHPEQIKNIDNTKPTDSADIRYSLSADSQGRELTAEQKEYFKDSKIVDENGNLKVMYHGTPNGEYTVFKDGTYFTENKWYADLYQNPNASSISTGKTASAPKTFEVYLNIKKPFDINDTEARNIYINDYIKGGNAVGINPYLSDAEYDKINSIDWTEGEDLREFLIENGYDFDGLVLDEGAVGGYGEDVKYRGKSYVVFSPEQVKNTDNANPTTNKDIRFSLSKNDDNISPNHYGIETVENDVFAPIRKDIEPNGSQKQKIAPLPSDAEENQRNSERLSSLTDEDAPTQLKAPIKQRSEAIKPTPEKLTGEEAQWAKNKMAKATAEEQTARILTEEPTATNKKKQSAISKFLNHLVDNATPFETLALKTGNRELDAKFNFMRYSENNAQRMIGEGDETRNIRSLKSIQKDVENSGLTEQLYSYLYHQLNVDRMTLEDRYDNTPNKPVMGYSVTADISRKAIAQLEAQHPQLKQYATDIYRFNSNLRKMLVDGGVISKETAKLWQEMYPHYVPIRRVGDEGLNVNVPLDTNRTGVNAPIKRATGGNRDILPLFDTMAQRTIQTYKAIAKNRFGVELKNTLGTTIDSQKTNLDEVLDGVDAHEELLQEGKNGRNPTFTVFENGERVTFEITEDMYDALKPTNDLFRGTSKILNKATNAFRGLTTEYNPAFLLTNVTKDIQDILMNSQHAPQTYAKIPEAAQQLLTNSGKYVKEYLSNGGEDLTYFDGKTNKFTQDKSGIRKLVGMPLDAIAKANNFIERIPRLAEYIASREAGASIEVAMLDAARVTTNFNAGGDVTKWANRNGATFLNASVQGFAQQVRNVREAKHKGLQGWLGLATKFTIAGLSAELLNHILWEDDEEYEELSDYVKDNYYVVAKYGDGKFIRIPKGRTVAVIQDAFEQVKNQLTGDDEADWQNFFQLFMNNIAPNNPIENNVFAPIIQTLNNKTWYGEDLVPTRLQDLPKAEQYDESTDMFSRWLGETFNVSPYKANYLINQYSGGIGDMLLPMLTPEAESGDNSLAGNLLAPIKDKFTTDSTMNNQNVADFYDTKDKLTTNAKASGATDEDILKSKYMNSINSELSKLYAEKREIQNSYMDDDEKYQAVKDIQQQIVDLTRNSLSNYDRVSMSGDYAKVGNKYFRKNDSGEWVKLTNKQIEQQEEVTESLKIDPAEYWSNKSEYDFAYEYPEKYAVAKSVGGYDAYKQYSSELYDIKADKDSNGKSINGSRKKKVIEYVNSLDIDYGARLIIFKSEYNADDTYNYEIIDYLNSRDDITYEEMNSICKELGFTVHSDGRITW